MTPWQFRTWRKRAKLTQQDVCARVGISRQTLIWFETGARASDKTVERLKQFTLEHGASAPE